MLPVRLLVNMSVQAKTNIELIANALNNSSDITEPLKSNIIDVTDFAYVTIDTLTEILSKLTGG